MIPRKQIFEKTISAFRIRLEGSRYIATLKRRSSAEAGLHKREEINAPVTDDDFVDNPTLSIFSGDASRSMIYRPKLQIRNLYL